MRAILSAVLLLAGLSAAEATSGFGCYRVNVGPSNPLNIREAPSSRSAVVASFSWADQPIIALDGVRRGEGIEPTLFDVHTTELAECLPATLPLGARWCPVTVFDEYGATPGWLKRRFVDHVECP